MLWIYGHYIYFDSFSAGTVFIGLRQNMMSVDVRFRRLYKDGPRTERVTVALSSATLAQHLTNIG